MEISRLHGNNEDLDKRNSIIAEIFTKNHGKTSGIIFGASSKKIKNFLQLGNKLHINYTY